MARLIDATRIEQYILNNCSDNEEINAIYGEIINAPTADAEPIKHGYWIHDGHHIRCSNCEVYFCGEDREGDSIPNSYCPNCGARMDEVEE